MLGAVLAQEAGVHTRFRRAAEPAVSGTKRVAGIINTKWIVGRDSWKIH